MSSRPRRRELQKERYAEVQKIWLAYLPDIMRLDCYNQAEVIKKMYMYRPVAMDTRLDLLLTTIDLGKRRGIRPPRDETAGSWSNAVRAYES